MLVGLVAAGFYSCFYGKNKGVLWAGAGAAGLSYLAFLFPQIRFFTPLLTTFWLMLTAGFCVRESEARARGERLEKLFLMGGIWLMAYCLADLGTGRALLRTGSLQTALAAALLLMGALKLLGYRGWHPLWMVILVILWLLVRFLGSITYAEIWQDQVMSMTLYLTGGMILVFQQVYCIWWKHGAWEEARGAGCLDHRTDLQKESAGSAENAEGMQNVEGKGKLSGGLLTVGFHSASEGSWREAAGREYRQLQIFEHDFRHHLDILAALYEKGNVAEARAYMEDLKQARESRRGRKIGGERELSYIMMAKKESCRQKEISFSYQIMGSPRGIAQMDMTALLLNLMDNAIRACEEAPQPRSIAVMLLSRGELWEIEMINSGHYKAKGKEWTRTDQKMEREIHGIGLVSVRQIVEKYQGSYQIWEEEGQVRQKLILVQQDGV